MSTRDNARSLQRQIENVVDADWGHPAWWLLTWLTGFLETVGRAPDPESRTFYHRANGGLHSDTYMGRPTTLLRDDRDLASWGAARTFAALAALEELDTALPGQPLRVALGWHGTWLKPGRLAPGDCRNVVFTVGGSHYLKSVPSPAADEASDADRLAASLERLLTGGDPQDGLRPVPPGQPVPAALAVSLDVYHDDAVRHVHRNVWTAQGGPWLGIGRTPTLDVVTTCHLVVDGLGHALLTERVLGKGPLPPGDPSRSDPGVHQSRPGPLPPHSLPTGVAWRYLQDGVGRFAEQAYATGLTLDAFFGRGGHAPCPLRHSPPFTVPIAPGSATDQNRRRRRVLHGLLSVRRSGNGFETLDEFSERLGPWLDTERAGRGILARISSAVSRSPLPRQLKHLALSNHHGPRSSIPSVEGLSGRARLSSIRFTDVAAPSAPIVAASLPTLLPNADDDRGGVVLTLLHHDVGTTVTVFGTGRTGSCAGAREFLDLWLKTLDDVRQG